MLISTSSELVKIPLLGSLIALTPTSLAKGPNTLNEAIRVAQKLLEEK